MTKPIKNFMSRLEIEMFRAFIGCALLLLAVAAATIISDMVNH